MGKFTTAYKEELKMPAPRWFGITLGVTLALLFLEAALIAKFPELFGSPLIMYPLLGLGALVSVIMVFFPLFKWEQRGSEIDRDMHLFITRMGVLSASESARKEMFDILQKMREYRSLAVEINKIFTLVDKWNVSLERSCRFVAMTTPSDLLADFLYRLAHGIEGGEPAEHFFQTEQVVVMNQYALKYQRAMTTVELMNEIFVSMVEAVLFILVFATLAPFLVKGEDPNAWLGASISIFLIVEIMFLAVMNTVVPGEDIWHNMAIQTPTHVMIKRGMWLSLVLNIGFAMVAVFIPTVAPSGIVLAIAWGLSIIMLIVSLVAYPKWHSSIIEGLVVAIILITIFFVATAVTGKVYAPLALAYILTPWVVPAHFVNTEEENIKRRDENFAAFLRSLGSAVASTSKDITVPLSKLRKHDFGPLTKNVDDLYKRLSLRILRPQAWEYYSAETLSELISKFTEMYVEGVKAGGSPKKVSQIISDNFLKIVGLRKMKYNASSSLTGILYGLCVVISLILYLMLSVLQRFDAMAGDLNKTLSSAGGGIAASQNLMILNSGAFNFDVLGYAVLFMIMAHALISALMTRVISGGHKVGAFWHFVLMVWLGGGVAVVVQEMAKLMLPAFP